MRTLFGIGTPKQWLAASKEARGAFLAVARACLTLLWRPLVVRTALVQAVSSKTISELMAERNFVLLPSRASYSTGC